MTFTTWRQPMTIEEINTVIDKRWPTLSGFDLRAQLMAMAEGHSIYWTVFAPKLEIIGMCLRAGLIAWVPSEKGVRHLRITQVGREAVAR